MVNTVGKKPVTEEWAYLAGIMDADGAIMATIEKHLATRYGYRIRVVLKVTQKTGLIPEWCASKFEVGKVVKNRTAEDWLVRDQNHVFYLITHLTPYLKGKAEQAKIALTIIKLYSQLKSHKDLMSIAQMTDQLASLNVRSSGRRKNFSSLVQQTSPVTTDR